MSGLDITTIILFSIGVLMTGVAFSKTGKDMKSFFAGGGDMPWGLSGLSLFMGFFSAGTFVVWGSIAYSLGFVSVIIQLSMAFAGFAVGTWIAPRWHKTGALTAAEYITGRLGANVQRIYTYIFLCVSIFTTGSFLYPVAKIVEVTSGLPLSTSILALGLFSMIYVTLGGLRGVVVTDVLQFIILFAAVIIVIPLSFDKIGGVGELLERAPQEFFTPFAGEYTPWFIFAFCIYNMFFLGGNWAYVQRYTSVKSPAAAKRVGWLFGCLYLVSPLLWMLPPMIYRVFNPDLLGLQNEDAYLLMCREAMPNGLLGLMLGGMIFATASSLNATLNISAGVFSNDIYKRLKPGISDTQLVKVARIATLGFGALAVMIALLIQSMGGIVNVVISLGALTGVPIYLPIIWSLFSKRQSSRTLLATTFISLTINIIFKFVTPALCSLTLSRGTEMLVGSLTPLILLSVIELYLIWRDYTDPKYIEYSKLQQEKTAVKTETVATVDNSTNRFTYKVLGISVALSGVVITTLGFLSNDSNVVPIVIGLLVALLGVVLIVKNREK